MPVCAQAMGVGNSREMLGLGDPCDSRLGLRACLHASDVAEPALGQTRQECRRSVLDLSRSPSQGPLYAIAHGLQLLGRVTDPVDKLTDDAKRFAAAE